MIKKEIEKEDRDYPFIFRRILYGDDDYEISKIKKKECISNNNNKIHSLIFILLFSLDMVIAIFSNYKKKTLIL
jgi:hypothetical protein